RLIRRNVMATSGRAVEAAGDVDVLLLDKTGTITLGNRMATAFLPAPNIQPERLADAAQLSSLAGGTPERRSIVVLAEEKFGLRGRELATVGHAGANAPSFNAGAASQPSSASKAIAASVSAHVPQFVPFTAQTRMSGVDFPAFNGQPARSIRKGAVDAMR